MNDVASWIFVVALASAGAFLLLLLVQLIRQYSPPQDAAQSVLAGTGYLQLGRLKDALAEGRRAVDLDPENPQAHELLAKLFLQSGDTTEAERETREAIRIDPEQDAYLQDLGVILLIRFFRDARGLPPNEALLELAMESFLQAQRLAPQDLYHDLYVRITEAALGVPPRPMNGSPQGKWPFPLIQLYTGQISENQLFEQLQKNVHADHLSEAHYFAALFCIGLSQQMEAKRHLLCCMRYKGDFGRISTVLLHSL